MQCPLTFKAWGGGWQREPTGLSWPQNFLIAEKTDRVGIISSTVARVRLLGQSVAKKLRITVAHWCMRSAALRSYLSDGVWSRVCKTYVFMHVWLCAYFPHVYTWVFVYICLYAYIYIYGKHVWAHVYICVYTWNGGVKGYMLCQCYLFPSS